MKKPILFSMFIPLFVFATHANALVCKAKRSDKKVDCDYQVEIDDRFMFFSAENCVFSDDNIKRPLRYVIVEAKKGPAGETVYTGALRISAPNRSTLTVTGDATSAEFIEVQGGNPIPMTCSLVARE